MSLDSVNSFNVIYTTFYRKSFLYVKSYVHEDMAAEDIVSESLIRLWQQMKQQPIDPIPPFLFTILKNRSLDYLKHQAVIRTVHHEMAATLNRELELRTASLEMSDPTDIFSAEVKQIIESTLNSLPEKTREIFKLSKFGNKPHKEIAELYNISVKGVDYHIMLSVKELRLALKDYLPLLGALTFLN
jgi:RNA polymerase sigma-70 factor (ECF subfamily)